jgi:uncharacterized protein (TIGR02246 family)
MGAKSPEDMIRVWTDAFNRGELDAIVELYEPEAVLARSSGPPIVGRAAIREAFTAFLATRPRMEATTRTVMSTADLALCYGNWSLRGTNADGTPRAISGKSVEILRKQTDGSWRYILDDPFSTGVS